MRNDLAIRERCTVGPGSCSVAARLRGAVLSRFATGLFVVAFVTAFADRAESYFSWGERCGERKHVASARYGACTASTLRYPDRTEDKLQSCLTRLTTAWDRIEALIASAGDVCPSMDDDGAISDFMLGCREAELDALHGGVLVSAPSDCSYELKQCTWDLTTCFSGSAACAADCSMSMRPPSLTGQTTCSDEWGDEIPCAGTGHDGDVQRGAPHSFTDNADGTITDNVTGLVWEKLSDDGGIHDVDNGYTWIDAFAVKAATLNLANFAGHADWRVPNVNELESIRLLTFIWPRVDSAFRRACTAGCTTAACSCTSSGSYWSSSSGRDGNAYALSFDDGELNTLTKINRFGVRLVRGN
jgi:hypothetical protein